MNAKAATLALLGLGAFVLVLLLVPSGTPETVAPGPANQGSAAAPKSVAAVSLADSPNAGLLKDAPASASSPGVVAEKKDGESGRSREQRLAKLAARLASLPAGEALAQIGALPDQESRDIAMVALLGELSGLSSVEIIRGGDVWRFGAGGALAVQLLESGKFTPAEAAALAMQNSDGNRRGELFARIGAELASENPAAALALGDNLQTWERRGFLEGLARGWSQSSPGEARQWIASLAEGETRDALLAGFLQAETRSNPASAAASFAAMPPSDPLIRTRTAMRIASEWASKDTLAAMQWADSLQETEQNAARQGIRNAAPVGIGAMLTPGPGGLPVVGNVVPGSPASAGGALQPGDTLLAVSDASGSWVGTRGMSFRDLLGLVRGEPNTQVSLQVQSPGSSAPRVVTLGRQQLIFRPGQN